LDLTRRNFLKGVGVGTAVSGLVIAPDEEAYAQDSTSAVRGPGEIPITFTLNGEAQTLKVEPRVTLLDAVRNRLNLTGPKKVCDRGTCGACTVLLDDEPVYACSLLAVEVEGRSITTIEGLGTPDNMSTVQNAFVENDAQQCGFCTPGFVTAVTAFVRKHPNASVEEVRDNLGGNLCRCGTYMGVIQAAYISAKQGGA
jgi:xanthine dehydrogenase YagT iron-sulfur-binding subunit